MANQPYPDPNTSEGVFPLVVSTSSFEAGINKTNEPLGGAQVSKILTSYYKITEKKAMVGNSASVPVSATATSPRLGRFPVAVGVSSTLATEKVSTTVSGLAPRNYIIGGSGGVRHAENDHRDCSHEVIVALERLLGQSLSTASLAARLGSKQQVHCFSIASINLQNKGRRISSSTKKPYFEKLMKNHRVNDLEKGSKRHYCGVFAKTTITHCPSALPKAGFKRSNVLWTQSSPLHAMDHRSNIKSCQLEYIK
ncbi:hypothetical protein J3A83DRAFT_2705518 [Scleroderma citrinum]